MATILVIEDERKMREGLRVNLEIDGYAVECASDGAKGLELLYEKTYDLVILDVMLPQISGFEILKKVRAKDRDPRSAPDGQGRRGGQGSRS